MPLLVSEVSHGNMHPSLERETGSAQANFDRFCKASNIEPMELLGLRIDPKWEDGARIIDLSNRSPEEIAKIPKGQVAVNARLLAHGVILPKKIGGFVLTSDCFPVSIHTETHHALCHIGRRSVTDFLLPKIFEALGKVDSSEVGLKVEIGPGVRSFSFIHNEILSQLESEGVPPEVIDSDGRDSFLNPDLHSRRAYFAGLLNKPRGNSVAIST